MVESEEKVQLCRIDLLHACRAADCKGSVQLLELRLVVFFVQRLLQFFLGLVVEFLVFPERFASLLPQLVGPSDDVHFFGCNRHGVPLFRCLEAGRSRPLVHVRTDISHARLTFHPLTFGTTRRKGCGLCFKLGAAVGNTFFQ